MKIGCWIWNCFDEVGASAFGKREKAFAAVLIDSRVLGFGYIMLTRRRLFADPIEGRIAI